MITSLAKLGATQHIQIIPDYDDKGNVNVAVLFRPKDGAIKINNLALSGTIAEVEGKLADFSADVDEIVALANSVEECKADLKKQADEAAAAAKAKAKTTVTSAKTTSKKPAKPEPVEPPKATVKLSEAAKKMGGAPASLKPAWKKPGTPAAEPAPAGDPDPTPVVSDDELLAMMAESEAAIPASVFTEGSTS